MNFSQNQTIESNLDGLVLEVGDTFMPESYVKNFDGTSRNCETLIYYNKKGVFNIGGSIVQDPSTGKIVANEPGKHEVVAVCVDSRNNGDRLSQTFIVSVNYSKTNSIELEISDEAFTGSYIPIKYKSITVSGNARNDLIADIKSSNPDVVSVDSNGLLKAIKKGESTLTLEVDGVKISKKIKIKASPVISLSISTSNNAVRTGDVITLSSKMYDKKGKEINNLNPTYSFHGISFDGSSSASGLIKHNKFVADVPGLYTVNAHFGNVTSSTKVKVIDRDIKRDIVQLGTGEVFDKHTSDAWFFEGVDGKDYGVSGTFFDGQAYFWDVSDPANITKVDSIKVDARIVNDVKVSKDSKICVITKEGASNRKNGFVILDISNPSDVKVLSEYSDGLTGGVHNVFIDNNHVYALNAFGNPAKFEVVNIEDPKNPKGVGKFELELGSAIHDIWIEDGIAYTSNWRDGLYIVDVGNGIAGGSPSNPVAVANYNYKTGANHAAFPFKSKSTGKFYVILGDEIFPEGVDFFAANETTGFLHFVDFTDLKNPVEVARYELPGYGSHNFWVEDDVVYAGMYNGGLRVIDVSGDLLGDLYKQGREIAAFKTGSPNGFIPNNTMTWGSQYFKGNIFYSDFNSGIGALKLLDTKPDNSKTMQFTTDKSLDSLFGAKNLLELFEILASPPIE
tara:strand:- start:1296 stop:3329 length:2034 start_codon:yes stop_codon:yes gene_type:complete